ncbi:pantetheinase-like [Oppia nitens]|uniref:pantetheinase-like n=1 Tax=Oppia nitens TaxID=1686743 RepID=UPI0023DCA696|nr:pantetheinase-like [Oppia nitens]
MNRNLDIFEIVTAKAADEGAKILVFPEDAIINTRYPRSKIAEISEQIPDPKKTTVVPCDNPIEFKDRVKTYRLSCFAKTNQLYIVADYGDRVNCDKSKDIQCPSDGHYLFNTAVAFGPDGAIVAKYHKMQLFHELYYNVPPKSEFSYFDTPFGRIGLFICFDIMFENPGSRLINGYGVQTMAFPLWWFDELPFKTANQLQHGWAFTNKVNLLAADMQNPLSGSIGSGIYSGQNGPLIESDMFGQRAQLLIADIPVDSRNTEAKCLNNRYNKTIEMKDLIDTSQYKPFVTLNLKNSALLRLKDEHNSVEVCNNGFCCQLDYEVINRKSLETEYYWLLVANRSGHGLQQIQYPLSEEFCGVFRCNDQNCNTYSIKSGQTVFKSLKISAKFTTNYTYPSVTTEGYKPVAIDKWIYNNNGHIGSDVTLSLNNFDNSILSLGLYGRCYDRDPPYKQ